MPRRRKDSSWPHGQPEADPAESAAAQLRGKDAEGNVRPADNRFLTPEEIADRDAYVAEVTGEDAQQLLVKREAPEHVEAISGRERGTKEAGK